MPLRLDKVNQQYDPGIQFVITDPPIRGVIYGPKGEVLKIIKEKREQFGYRLR